MENQNSNSFQLQYPLSKKKFWKKIIGKYLFYFFLALVPGFIGAMLAVSKNKNIGVSSVVGTGIAVTIVCSIIFSIIYSWYVGAYIKRYYYNADDLFVTIRKGVFAPSEIHVQYAKIQDVYVDQDVLDRIMGLYDVHIASATIGSSIEAHIDGVEKSVADGLKEFLFSKIRGSTSTSIQSSTAIPTSSASVSFSKHVSSLEYPVLGAWLFSKSINFFFTNLLIIVLLAFKIVSPSSSSTTTYSLNSNFFLFLAVVFIGIFLLQLILLFIWRKNYYFELLPEYIVMRTGIFNRQETHIPYKSIQDITVQQRLIDRIFGTSNVIIENAAFGGVGRSSSIAIFGQSKSAATEISDILRAALSSQSNFSTSLGV